MPDPTTESRLISLEQAMDRLQDSLQQLIEVQKELKNVSIETVKLLSDNRFLGARVEQLERKFDASLNCIRVLEVSQGKVDTQMRGVWGIVSLLIGIAMVLFGWFLK